MRAKVILPDGRKVIGEIKEWFGAGDCAVAPTEYGGRYRGILEEVFHRRLANDEYNRVAHERTLERIKGYSGSSRSRSTARTRSSNSAKDNSNASDSKHSR